MNSGSHVRRVEALAVFLGVGTAAGPQGPQRVDDRDSRATITTSTTVPVSPGTSQLVGADGTVVMTTRNPRRLAVTVVHPDGHTVPVVIDATPVGVQAGDDGTVALTTRTGTGSAADPYYTTVTVIHPDSDVTTPLTIKGTSGTSAAQVNADGSIILSSYTGNADEPYVTSVSVIQPNGDISTPLRIDGTTVNSVRVGSDGTAALLTRVGIGTAADPCRITLSVMHPDRAITTAPVSGITNLVQSDVQIGSDGTVAVGGFIASGNQADPNRTYVTVIRPNGDTSNTELGGSPTSTQVGADGTVLQVTESRSFPPRTFVTALRSAGATTTAVDGSSVSTPISADGHLYIVTRAGGMGPTDPPRTSVTIVSASGKTRTISLGGVPSGTQLAHNGDLVQITGSIPTGPADPVRTTVTLIAPTGRASSVTTVPGNTLSMQRAADGTFAITTGSFGENGLVRVLTVVHPTGPNTVLPITGALFDTRVSAAGSVIQTTENPGPRTTVTIVHATGQVSTLIIDGTPLAIRVGTDERVYLLTRAGVNPVGPSVVTVSAIALAHPAAVAIAVMAA